MIAIGVLGIVVSEFAVVVPEVLTDYVALADAATAMGVNRVIRTLGYVVCGTVAGLMLAEPTHRGHVFPAATGHAQCDPKLGVVVLVVTFAAAATFRRLLRGDYGRIVPAPPTADWATLA